MHPKGIAPKGSDALMVVVWFLNAVLNFPPVRVLRDNSAILVVGRQPVLFPIAVLRHQAVHVQEIKCVPTENACCLVVVPRLLMVSAL